MITALELIAKFWQQISAAWRWLRPSGLPSSKLLLANQVMDLYDRACDSSIATPETTALAQATIDNAILHAFDAVEFKAENGRQLPATAVSVLRLVAAARLPQLQEPAQQPDELQEGGQDADK